MPKYTLTVAADAKYGPQLEHSVKTWRRFRPELWENPLLFMYDQDWISTSEGARRFCNEVFNHNDVTTVAWPTPDYENTEFETQREKMLTAHVVVPSRFVETPWWLKLDCDAIATSDEPWQQPEWFRPDAHGRTAAAIASGWNYTKTTDGRPWTTVLDDWGNENFYLKEWEPLNIPWAEGVKRCGHPRWCSWICFVSTHWGRAAAQLIPHGERLPVPSQDTYLWYVFERWQARVVRNKFKKNGWTNIPRLSTLAQKAQEVLNQ